MFLSRYKFCIVIWRFTGIFYFLIIKTYASINKRTNRKKISSKFSINEFYVVQNYFLPRIKFKRFLFYILQIYKQISSKYLPSFILYLLAKTKKKKTIRNNKAKIEIKGTYVKGKYFNLHGVSYYTRMYVEFNISRYKYRNKCS